VPCTPVTGGISRRDNDHIGDRGTGRVRQVLLVSVDGLIKWMPPISSLYTRARRWLVADDVGLRWLQDQSKTNVANVANVIGQLTKPANEVAMFANVLPPGTVFDANVSFGPELSAIYGYRSPESLGTCRSMGGLSSAGSEAEICYHLRP
jgi:hypothetical protein